MYYLTSFRGIAAFGVVLYHLRTFISEDSLLHSFASLVDRGYLAVDFFFVLSGFIISLRYAEWFQQGNMALIWEYSLRRFSRIFPAHALCLLIYLAIVALIVVTGRDVPAEFTTDSFFIKLFLIDAWLIGTDYWNYWNVPSWTISGEIFAYMLFPVLIRLLIGSLVKLVCCFSTIVLLIAGLYEIFDYNSLGNGIGELGLVRCILEFSLGILVFRFYNLKEYIHFSSIYFFLFLGGSVVLIYFFTKDHLFIPLLFALLLFTSLYLPDYIKKFFEAKLLIWLGNISYSVYLSHMSVLYIYALALPSSSVKFDTYQLFMYVGTVLLVSHIIFHWVEKPGRRFLRNTFARRK